ncbi:MAG: FecR family protein [Thiobacillus sp.]|nr:FecR family protein [Thiobacillus sp.]
MASTRFDAHRPRVGIVPCVLLAVLLAWLPLAESATTTPAVGTAKNAIGTLLVIHSDGIEERLRGQGTLVLYEGDVLSTSADSRALIELRDGTWVGFDFATRARLLSRWEKGKGDTRILRLEIGTLWIKTGSNAKPLEVETPVASAAAIIESGGKIEFMIATLDDGNSMLSVIDGVVPFGTAFGTCPIKPSTVSYAVQGKKCTKAEALDTKRAAAWTAKLAKGREAMAAAPLPTFWPPPDTSTHQVIPRELLVDGSAKPTTLAALAAKMEKALNRTGYSSPGYYAVPGGFAMLTQLERIHPDATPFPADQRWKIKVDPASLSSFNLSAYLKALLGKDAGVFRVIAFVFTAEPIVSDNVKPVMDEAKHWVEQGGKALPGSYAAQPFSADMVCTALIYEFEIPTHGAPGRQRKPSEHNGQEHLRAARILQALGG